MAKILDITDKLSFDSNPKLVIKGKEVEINADAPTMLKVMALMKDDTDVEDIIKAYETIFTEEARMVLDSLSLPFSDLIIVIRYAIDLIKGEDSVGE